MIVMTPARIKFETAQRQFGRKFNRAYNLSEQGHFEKAERMRKQAVAEFEAAKAEYERSVS